MSKSGVRIHPSVEDAIVKAYVDGEAGASIAARNGVHVSTVYDVVRRKGASVRKSSQAHRSYSCNHHYFDTIDTESKAYWLGFLAADGCVTDSDGTPRLELVLSSRDRGHVQKFCEAIESTHPIADFNNNGYPGVALRIRSAEMAAGLAQHGVTPRKSLTAAPPALAPSLMRHYWRGAFDGDGCICESSSGVWAVNFVASHLVADAFAHFAHWSAGARPSTKPQREGGVFYFRTSGIHLVRALLRALYDEAAVYLDRKHALYQRVLTVKPKGPPKVRGAYT